MLLAIIGIIVGLIAIAITIYYAKRPKTPFELESDIVKIRAELHQVALYLDGLPKTKDKDKKALFEKGISLMAQYKYEQAIDSFRECLALETEGSEKVALLILIGNSFHAWNKWDPALGSWKEALDTAEQAEDEQGQAAALGNLGVVYQNKGEWDKAIEFYNKSLKIKEKIGDEYGMAQTFGNLGLVYKDKREWDKAIEFYNKALKGLEKVGDEHGMAKTKANIGILYKAQGKKEEAKKLLEESLKTFEKIGDRPNAEIVRKHLEGL
jgi:tetratricopeptide (TPR) repeat protein